MDTEWSRWRQEIFGDPYLVWHDGPDFTTMLAAARFDPMPVARMLRAGLADDDPLAAQGFTELAVAGLAPPDATSLLRGAAASASGLLLIRSAEALFALTLDSSWAGRIVPVLRHDDSESVRVEAAIALAGFPPVAEVVAALADAVSDPAYLVRYHAATTLIRYGGGTGDLSDGPALFAQITSDDPAQWRAAAAELAAHAV